MISFFLLFIPMLSWTDPTPGEKYLADQVVREFYINQNISDAEGHLLSSIIIKQEIRNIVGNKESLIFTHLFMKDEDTYLVYLKNERNESICYLYRGDNQWVYRENMNNPMRVNMSQNVSGMANLGDLIGINILRDFDLNHIIQNTDSYSLHYDRAVSSFPYPSIVIDVDKSTNSINSIEYQGLGSRSMKRVNLIDYRVISGNHRIPVWQIRNLVTDMGDFTEIKYLSIEEIKIPSGFFTPTGNSLNHFLKWSDALLN